MPKLVVYVKRFVISSLVFVCSLANASEWATISKYETANIDILVGSIVRSNAVSETGIIAIGRIIDSNSQQVIAEQWFVTANACISKRGYLMTLDFDGKLKHRNEFVFGLGTVASDIAEVMCTVAKESGKHKQKGTV